MKDYVIKFNRTGECEIDIKKVIKQWNNRCYIKQYHEDYRICQYSFRCGKNTGRCSKITISKIQAHDLIGRLNLLYNQSGLLKHAGMWRTVSSEEEMVEIEVNAYRERCRKKAIA